MYPLDLNFCKKCSNSQLSVVVPPEKMFNNYLRVVDGSIYTVENFGVAKYSKLIAAIKAAIQRNNDKNSLVKPLDNDITPEAIKITKIAQSVKFNPKASNELFLH